MNNHIQGVAGQELAALMSARVLVLDGAMGTMIQAYGLTEEGFRRERFAGFTHSLKGNNEILNLTHPEIILDIHRQYIDAGADIITTNTLNATTISMADYGVENLAHEINVAAARIAREAADGYKGRKIYVAGSVGPTNKTASMGPDVNNPAYRAVTYDELYIAYYEQIDGLIEGGVDIILFETVFDTLNVKAGLDAVVGMMSDRDCQLPVMLSFTLSGKGGRNFSGQTIEAFLTSVEHAPLLSIGLNCSFGARDMKPYLKELADISPYFISAYPNAGLPNQFGQYEETPATMADQMMAFVDEGLVNIIGGCCGTTPNHIAAYKHLVINAKPYKAVERPPVLRLSGLEMLEVKPENNFINIGERCNVAGSRKFLRLIKEKNYEEALAVARKQVEDGAQIIDINMDDGLLDAVEEIKTFLNLIAMEPDIARVPVMLDSSKWLVLEEGLKCVQGKSIVNSISLKEGEEMFLSRAARIRRLGAAAIVMAFDEKGQADSFERKVEVCGRAYRLLTEKIDFPPQDIIFDPNVLAIATGMAEHDGYGRDFIRAVEWIKTNLPLAKVSGGVSNLSFSFRGNDYVREAMHAVFLYHAINAGLDMGIVNPSSSVTYEDIEPTFRSLLEDVILARRPDAADEFIAYAQQINERKTPTEHDKSHETWREEPLDARLEYALIKGNCDFIEDDLQEAMTLYPRAVDIIDGPLMRGMNRAGELFGSGKMFLPQVVKTARTMKKAVAILQPAIEKDNTKSGMAKKGKIVFATVKGDVHDIGKNIVSIVLSCNNYEVIDLGVMVPAEKIIQTVIAEKPDILCLSGLITPSLEEMANVAVEMRKAGMTIPIMVGGATTSKLHTVLKIAPHYDHLVIHGADASQTPLIAAKLMNPFEREAYIAELNAEYARLRQLHETTTETKKLLTLEKAREKRYKIDLSDYKSFAPRIKGVRRLSIPVVELIPFIDWTFFFTAWRLSGRYRDIAHLECDSCRAGWLAGQPDDEREKAQEALSLYDDARKLLRALPVGTSCEAVIGFFEAFSSGDDIVIVRSQDSDSRLTIPVLRQQIPGDNGLCLSLADFIAPKTEGLTDYIGLFALTAGNIVAALENQIENEDYKKILVQTLSDRLAEAAAEYLHERVRKEFWGYAPDENLTVEDEFKARYQGIRPAVGYPSLPDQTIIFELDKLLNINDIGIGLTENGAMAPTSSVAGFYFAHPASKYFMTGKISEEQLLDYAARYGKPADMLKKFLVKNLFS